MSHTFSEFLDKTNRYPLLSKREEQQIANRLALARKLGDTAEYNRMREKLVMHNIRLAVHIARKYQHHNVPLEDLVQEAMIGVQRAAEKFDPKKGFKFSTYAVWWIRHFVQRAIHKEKSTIRVPGHIQDRQRRIDKYLREHPEENMADAADYLDITMEQAEDAMMGGARVVASLDQPFKGEEYGDRYSSMPDPGAPDPADLLADQHPRLVIAMDIVLNELERRVIEMRFGFNDQPVKSRDQVAEELGIRPHVVQKCQRDGLKKLGDELGSAELSE